MPFESLRKQFPPYLPRKGEEYMSARQRATCVSSRIFGT